MYIEIVNDNDLTVYTICIFCYKISDSDDNQIIIKYVDDDRHCAQKTPCQGWELFIMVLNKINSAEIKANRQVLGSMSFLI